MGLVITRSTLLYLIVGGVEVIWGSRVVDVFPQNIKI